MENIDPTSINNGWQWAALAVGALGTIAGGYIKLRADAKPKEGNGKAVTQDKVDLAILENCAQCSRIGEIKSEVQEARTDIREMRARIDYIYTKLGGV